MKQANSGGGWSPYIAGALVGVLAIVSVIVTTSYLGKTNYLGATTSFVRAAGFAEKSVAPRRVAANEYFRKTGIRVDWQFMLIAGIFIGALVSAVSDRSFKLEKTPPVWNSRFGNSMVVRAAGAFLGGVVAMFGARLADGCPSGHGLSGLMQLSVSGLVAMVMFFAAGIVFAGIIYRGR